MITLENELHCLQIDEPRTGIARITLNRPERLNALSWPMVDECLELWGRLAGDPGLRVVILTGAGRGFCAGLDLQQREDALGGGDDLRTVCLRQEKIGMLATSLRRLPVPVIAAVNGPAAGGGFAIALACDIRLAAPEASFHASFVRVGLSACDAGVSYLLPRVVGLGHAAEIMFTGRRVGAEEAARIGLVNRVVTEGELDEAAAGLAEQIAANSPMGVWMSKRGLLCNVDAPSLEAAIELENRSQALATRTSDMQEALAAFREKRPASFSGS